MEEDKEWEETTWGDRWEEEVSDVKSHKGGFTVHLLWEKQHEDRRKEGDMKEERFY